MEDWAAVVIDAPEEYFHTVIDHRDGLLERAGGEADGGHLELAVTFYALWMILSWSRSKGLFAGVSLDGATLRNDLDENQALYGQRWTSKQILGSGAKQPEQAAKLIAVLNKYSMKQKQ